MSLPRARLVTLNAALGPLDYRVPEGMAVEPGSIVVAPLGPRQLIGVAWEADRLQSEEVGDNRLRSPHHSNGKVLRRSPETTTHCGH
jgi:primosomal protein N' (replication factor Y)